MTINRRIFGLTLILSTFVASRIMAESQDGMPSWDGTWVGELGRSSAWPIKITIVDGKVVGYLADGASVDIRYSEVTDKTVSFGDHDNYFIKLEKTSSKTAVARVHGRHGDALVSLTKLP
jgi:hypothetical protein